MSAPTTSDRPVAFFTALVAVLAALCTLFSNHRSIVALSLRNEALLTTAQASDQYGYYQSKQLKVTMYQALIASNANGPGAQAMRESLRDEQRSSIAVFARAKAFEAQSTQEQAHAQALLHSFETLEIATTLLEISIAFASIAALTHLRLTLWVGVALSSIGVVLGVAGYFQAH